MKDPYTQQEYLDDLFNLIWEGSIDGREIGWGEQKMEYAYVHTMFAALDMFQVTGSAPAQKSLDEFCAEYETELPCCFMEYGCRHDAVSMTSSTKESDLKINTKTLYFAQLGKMKRLLEERSKSTSGSLKNHYEYLLFEIDRALK